MLIYNTYYPNEHLILMTLCHVMLKIAIIAAISMLSWLFSLINNHTLVQLKVGADEDDM